MFISLFSWPTVTHTKKKTWQYQGTFSISGMWTTTLRRIKHHCFCLIFFWTTAGKDFTITLKCTLTNISFYTIYCIYAAGWKLNYSSDTWKKADILHPTFRVDFLLFCQMHTLLDWHCSSHLVSLWEDTAEGQTGGHTHTHTHTLQGFFFLFFFFFWLRTLTGEAGGSSVAFLSEAEMLRQEQMSLLSEFQ